MADPQKLNVFISHAQEDSDWASKLAHELKSQDLSVWSDQEIEIGDRWEKKMEEALRDSDVFIAVITPNYLTSASSAFELGAALAGNKKIIPILNQETAPTSMPSLLRNRRLLKEPSPQAAGRAVREVVGHLAPGVAKFGR